MNLCTSPQPHAKARTAALRRLALVLALLVLAALACSEGAEPPRSNVDSSTRIDNSVETMPLCRYNCTEQTGIVNSSIQVGEPEVNIASDNQFGGQRTTVRVIDSAGAEVLWCVPDAEQASFLDFIRRGIGGRGNAQEGACE